jgi:hypothetical protein
MSQRDRTLVMDAVQVLFDSVGVGGVTLAGVARATTLDPRRIVEVMGTDDLLEPFLDDQADQMALAMRMALDAAADIETGLAMAVEFFIEFVSSRPSWQPPLREGTVTWLVQHASGILARQTAVAADVFASDLGVTPQAAAAGAEVYTRLIFLQAIVSTDGSIAEDARLIAEATVAQLERAR